MDKALQELTDKLTKAYGAQLVSLVLYGSAADGNQDRFSDLNVLCVLDRLTPTELGRSEPVFRWWREKGNPAPLLLSLDEVRTSTDCFPIEFHDIRERHRLLAGQDVISGLSVDDAFYRARVEYELRTKLLRLRQKAAGLLSDSELLLRLMADSVSTFCVLLRHALRLSGHRAPFSRREVALEARDALGLDAGPFLTLLDLREAKIKPGELRPLSLFTQYLGEIQKAIDAVDRLEK